MTPFPKNRKSACLLWVFALFLFWHCFPSTLSAQPATLWADSCTGSSFVGTINLNTQQVSYCSFNQVHGYSGGDIIVVGSIHPNLTGSTSAQRFGLVMRISKTGVIRWTKFIGISDNFSANNTSISCSVITHDDHIVIVTERYILSLDGNGSVVWQHGIPLFYSYVTLYQQIIETSDNGFLMGGLGSNDNGLTVKLNASGQLSWARMFWFDNLTICRNLIETPTGYYFQGYNYNLVADFRQNLLVKFNKQNGDTIWAKSIGRPSMGAGYTEYVYDYMEYKQGKLILSGATAVNYYGTNRSSQAVIQLDEAGNLLDAKRLTNPNIEVARSTIFKGKSFDWSTKTGVQYSNENSSDLHLYRLDNQFNLLWAWKFPMGDQEIANDMTVLSDSSVVISGAAISTTPTYAQNAILVKATNTGLLGNCTAVPFTPVITTPTINIFPYTLNTSNVFPTSTATDALPVFAGYGFNWQLTCASENSCRLGKIQGSRTSCIGATSVYTARRDGVYNNPVRYSCTNPSVQIQALSDTSASVHFTTAGQVVLYATMQSACGILKDSIIINALGSPGAVNLGPDTSICPSNMLTMNARSGYLSYRWQNGATDSAIQVTMPGIYYVTVLDACGGSFSDTIMVLQAPPISFDVGPNRTKCNGDTLHLSAPVGLLNYTWYNNYNINSTSTPSVIINPLVDTAYYVKAEKTPGCFAYDTVQITVLQSPPINLGSDKRFCSGDSVVFDAGAGFQGYLWSTMATTAQITATAVGSYSVIGTAANGCKSFDTVQVSTIYSLPVVHLNKDSTICKDGNKTLDAGNFSTYLWSTGSTARTITINSTGLYRVMVSDANSCKGVDTVAINTIRSSPTSFLPPDTSVCSYGKIELKPLSTYNKYVWNTGAITSSIVVEQPGIYFLRVADAFACAGTDSITVVAKECQKGFYIPTAFTPDGNGQNDLFKPMLFGLVKKYAFTVFNRWGQVIFTTTEVEKGWNGRVMGSLQSTGVYAWICTYQLEGEPVKQEKGTVVVIY